ncbi:hypothetical protein [Bordetella pertussis]|uniref:hypothetical protein n=1 Tax=Bordetella pertussis TaxID=520 RepID=UPI001EE0525A|nr:hypothetical protein [Bordetella pertussis]
MSMRSNACFSCCMTVCIGSVAIGASGAGGLQLRTGLEQLRENLVDDFRPCVRNVAAQGCSSASKILIFRKWRQIGATPAR